jgi:hypothetical protein
MVLRRAILGSKSGLAALAILENVEGRSNRNYGEE